MLFLQFYSTSPFSRLGLAYVGSHREDIIALLLPNVVDDTVSMEIASLSALSLGLIGVGSCNYDVTSSILQTLMEREDSQLSVKWARFMVLGLALLFLGTTWRQLLSVNLSCIQDVRMPQMLRLKL